MAELVPAIHVSAFPTLKTWMPGASPGMTNQQYTIRVIHSAGLACAASVARAAAARRSTKRTDRIDPS
jgi:hypothetical protein